MHDLIVNRVNDHRAGLANGDIVRVEAIEDDGTVTVRKMTGRDPETGAPLFGGEAIARTSLQRVRLCLRPHGAHRPGRPGHGRHPPGDRQRGPELALPGDDAGHRRELRRGDDELAAHLRPRRRAGGRTRARAVRPPAARAGRPAAARRGRRRHLTSGRPRRSSPT